MNFEIPEETMDQWTTVGTATIEIQMHTVCVFLQVVESVQLSRIN